MTKKELEETGKLLLGALMLLGCLAWLSGCAGEVYLGTRRIDEVQQTQVMKDKSWKEVVWGNTQREGK